MPVMNLTQANTVNIPVTVTSTGATKNIDAGDIIYIVTNASSTASIFYDDGRRGDPKELVVDETAAAVSALALNTINVNANNEPDGSIYISEGRVKNLDTVEEFQIHTMTLTGTSGTANIDINGNLYLATWDTSLTDTATAFLTTNAATILATEQVTATSNGVDVVLKHITRGVVFTSVAPANASGNLAGTKAVTQLANSTNILYNNGRSGRSFVNVDETPAEVRALIDAVVTTSGEPLNKTVTTGITAYATGGQANAVALTTSFNNVTTCATAGDSVKLRAVTAIGDFQEVANNGAAPLAIFPATGDKINGGSANASVTLNPGAMLRFWTLKDSENWVTNRDLPSITATGITAFATGGQTDAVLLVKTYNEVSTVATAGDSVKLPAAAANQIVVVKNDGVASMDLFPNSSDTINDGSANIAIAIAPNAMVWAFCVDDTNWETSITSDLAIPMSRTSAITAFATGGQGSAVALVTTFSEITVCATEEDSVKLPAAVVGQTQYIQVKNTGVAPAAIFPASSDTIDGLSADASVPLGVGATMGFWSIDAANWESLRDIPSTAVTGIVAFATGGQGSAVLLTGTYNEVSTVATAADSVLLPVTTTGVAQVVTLKNSGVAALALFPAGSGTINGGSASASVTIGVGKTVTCWSVDALNWETTDLNESVPANSTTGIVAFATGGQGSAVLLTTTYNEIITCATAADSVKLPAAVVSNAEVYTVKNNGVAALAVFPNTSDTINDGTVNVAVSVGVGATATFWSVDATNWESTELDISVPSTSTTGITAFSTGGQGSAVLLTTTYNEVTVCAAAADSVKLPPAVISASEIFVVKNNGVAALAVFPNTSDTINDGSVNIAVSVPIGQTAKFTSVDATNWESTVLYTPMPLTNTTGVTAFSGGGQGSAVLLTTKYNDITVVAADGDSVKLPTALAEGNQSFTVKNSGAQDLDVFPNTTDTINGLSADVALRMMPGDVKTFWSISASEWETIEVTPIGVANTGTTAEEQGTGISHKTILTVSITLPAITGDTDQALGKLLYTFPASGVIAVRGVWMSMAITQSQGNINNDTPDGGIGTTIGTGGNALLSANPLFENMLTGQTFNNCTGTVEVKTQVTPSLAIETGGDHTVFFNVADGWDAAGGGDNAATIAGTIIILWDHIT